MGDPSHIYHIMITVHTMFQQFKLQGYCKTLHIYTNMINRKIYKFLQLWSLDTIFHNWSLDIIFHNFLKMHNERVFTIKFQNAISHANAEENTWGEQIAILWNAPTSSQGNVSFRSVNALIILLTSFWFASSNMSLSFAFYLSMCLPIRSSINPSIHLWSK